MSRYMNQVQYAEIMKYENLNESIAVKAYLRHAIAVAQEEKRQGWRYVEDGAKFLAYLEVKYDGDLKQATEVEKLQIQLTTLYDQMYRKRSEGEMR